MHAMLKPIGTLCLSLLGSCSSSSRGSRRYTYVLCGLTPRLAWRLFGPHPPELGTGALPMQRLLSAGVHPWGCAHVTHGRGGSARHPPGRRRNSCPCCLQATPGAGAPSDPFGDWSNFSLTAAKMPAAGPDVYPVIRWGGLVRLGWCGWPSAALADDALHCMSSTPQVHACVRRG